MRHRTLTHLVRAAVAVAGRPRVAKLARLVTNEVRLDGPNGIESNGEQLVQRAALTDRDPVVLDVGCHFGEWSQSLLAQPGAVPTIHAFEPSAASLARAREALAGRATVHGVALSDHAGEAELNIVHVGAGSNSLVAFTDPDRPSAGTERVVLDTVDRFCAVHGLDRVTLLKIDAEGHDLSVIRGAADMLARRQIGLMQFEYNWRWIEARTFLLDAFEILQGQGYRVAKITPKGIEPYAGWHFELESFREANFLAYLPEWETAFDTVTWWAQPQSTSRVRTNRAGAPT